MPNPWDPPDDPTGGYVLLEYSNGVYFHRQRFHINHFDASSFDYVSPGSREANVGTTLTNYATQWQNFYTDAWTLRLVDVVQQVSDGVFTPVTPPPPFTPVVGASTDAVAASPAGMTIFNGVTTNGGRMRPTLIANTLWDANAPEIATSATSGRVGDMIAYLSGSDTQIVGHDGGLLVDYCRLTFPLNRRLRRHYHLD